MTIKKKRKRNVPKGFKKTEGLDGAHSPSKLGDDGALGEHSEPLFHIPAFVGRCRQAEFPAQ